MRRTGTWGFTLAFILVATASLPGQQPTGEASDQPSLPVLAEPESPTQREAGASGFASVSMLRLIRLNGTARIEIGRPLSGAVGITFALYEEQEGRSPLWLETQNVALDTQGRYTALLGSTSNEGLPLEIFTSGEARWLGIQVQGQPEQPRILLVSVPYALRAEEAQRLAGREASEFLLAEQMESNVQRVVETKVVEEMEAQGLVSTEEGVTRTITDGASTFTDSNATQVVQVTQNGSGKAVKAASTAGNTIEAESTGTSGTNFTLLGINRSTAGRALFGFASATSGNTIAAAGRNDSTAGIGFFGQAFATSGQTVAVQGEVRSPSGIAGVFANTAGGPLLEGRSQGQVVFSVDGNGKIEADGTTNVDGLRTETNATSPNVIGGFSGNTVAGGLMGATIGGGGASVVINQITGTGNFGTIGGGQENIVSADAATVAGGQGNTASNLQATVSGGLNNTASNSTATVGGGAANTASGINATVGGGDTNSASDFDATVGGGAGNSASGPFTTVGGGSFNTASGPSSATVGGGGNNTASGNAATVPGGFSNTAAGSYSLAAGRRAKANHDGTFVWGDSTDADFASTAVDQFLIRAAGGVGIGTTNPTDNLTVQGSGNVFVAGNSNSFFRVTASGNSRLSLSDGAAHEAGFISFGHNGSTENILQIAGCNDAGSCPEFTTFHESGNVGIGTDDPADLLHVDGNVRLQSVNDLSGSCILNCPSDARLKKNVEALGPVLDQLVRLEPVRFRWRAEEYPELGLGSAPHTGLVAQQVQEILPELASVRLDGFQTVKYHELPVLLLQAIRELKAENGHLKQELATRLGSLEAELAALKVVLIESDDNQLAALKSQE